LFHNRTQLFKVVCNTFYTTDKGREMRSLLILFLCESTPFNDISFQSSSKARKRAKLNGSECAFDELNILCIYIY